MKPILALDVGDKRIGVARSDALGITAQPLETYTRIGKQADARHIISLAAVSGTDTAIVGLPRNMDGTLGAQAEKTLDFARALTQGGLLVKFVDERLTTASARRTLIEGGVRRDKRKQVVDKIAAVEILKTYLDAPQRALAWEDLQ